MDIIYAPIKNKEGQVEQVIEVLRDITEMRKMEEQIRRSERWVTIGEIAACVAHEINNPIGIILGFTQRLLERAIENTMDHEELKIIEKECIRCSKIVEDLFDFAKPSIPQKCLLNEGKIKEIINNCLNLLEFRIHERGIRAKLNLAHGSTIDIDPLQFQQVLLNILLNAIHAMPHGGELRISVSMQTHHAKYLNGLTRIVIEDTGVGISPEILPSIFELFFTTRERGTGTGLGLPITKRIIETHGGAIYVESEVERGTRIIIEIPREKEQS